MTTSVRPDVVDALVRRLVRRGPEAFGLHLGAGILRAAGLGEGPGEATAEEYRWAIQRVKGMTDPEMAAEADPEPVYPRLRLILGDDNASS